MGWYDVRQHYRRSVLGPFWLTLSMGIMVGALGFLYGGLFGHSMQDYLPYLALGLIFWAFMASFMTEGCTVFTAAAPFIHQVNAPLSIYPFRLLWKNLIILAHNALVFLGDRSPVWRVAWSRHNFPDARSGVGRHRRLLD